MSGGQQQFLTIAGRWKQHLAVSGLDKVLPRRELGIATMMFYAGFTAALEANIEVAEFPEGEAVQLLRALQAEGEQFAVLAFRMLQEPSSGTPAGH